MRRSAIIMAATIALAAPAAAQVDVHQGTALMKALREAQGSMAQQLVEQHGKAIVNYREPGGDSPLHVSVRGRNGDWTGYLLFKGADPNLAGPNGDTPLIEAARIGWRQGLLRLIGARAEVDRPNRRGETPLIVAVQQRQTESVAILLRAGADPDRKDYAAGYSARDYARRETRSPQLLRLIESTPRPARRAGPTR